ncbi:BQ5605_C005g03657 [Microbotryum silenes-dioicae]|uniref:BQ5605_C005g03657 protein n=1 Tax=Microbotryum silenes-dioicae TaxID=796604 RepID=A0A2X0PDK4_9BASI|nr:BQ5605_C005g03657 [Microbotryum silenes-dioicae]
MSNTSASPDEDGLAQFLDQAEQAFASAWNALSTMSPQLNALPSEIHDSLHEIYNRLTNNGTLSVLPSSWTETPVAWAYDSSPPSAASTAPTVAAAPPASSSPIAFLGRHPYLVAFVVTSGGLGTAHYLYPAATSRVLRPVTSRLPVDLASLSPRSLVKRAGGGPVRPARLLQHGHIEIRKEAVLVLGCDSPLFADLALDLEARGFVVIATVSNPNAVDALEKRSRGWLKVLVLDGNDATSVAPFLRSLATALSLRFPLRSAGDPFARPAYALVLSACINALSIDADKNDLTPVEAMDTDTVRRYVGEKIATFSGIVRGVVPILRSAANRPEAPRGVFLHLAPSTSPLSLPFDSLASASDAAISSLLTSLRRELHATSSPSNIRVKSLSLGLFDVQALLTSTKKTAENLSTRISSLYSTSLSTRSTVLTTHHRKGTFAKRLHSRVFHILTRSAVSSLWTPSCVGAGAWTHRVATNWYPHWVMDSFLRMQNWLYMMYFSRRIGGSSSSVATSTRLGGGPGGSVPPSYASATSHHRQRPPLPPTPTTSTHTSASGQGHQNPPSLRPGGASREKSTSTPATSSRAASTASSEESGTEDLLFSSMHDDAGMGSFVHVPSTSSSQQGLFRQEV